MRCFVLVLVIVSVMGQDDKVEDNPVGRLNDELAGVSYDHQAWRAVEPATQNDETEWRPEEPRPDPPRRRRKRKRRPQPQIEDSVGEQDGVRFSIDAGIQVEDERPRRRPARPQEWRGDEERPRRRGHRRKQRPYLPNLGDGPSGQGFPILESNVRVEEKEYTNADPIENVELTTIGVPEDESTKDSAQSDKSYRKQYSQAKRQEAEEMAMIGGSGDLKALLKQSGGLSLSEVLQQRNLSLADLLTGKQNALSALKPTEESGLTTEAPVKDTPKPDRRKSDVSKRLEPTDEGFDTEKPRRRLPPVSRNQAQRRARPEEGSQDRNDSVRRRLPAANRRQRPQAAKDEKEVTTTEYPIKSLDENLIEENQTTDDTTNLVDEDFDITTTTQAAPTTTIKIEKKQEEVRSRLSLKPRLRLPAVKAVPKRMLNPSLKPKEDNKIEKSAVSQQNRTTAPPKVAPKRAPIPNQAIPINLKDIFGMSEIVSAAKKISEPEVRVKESKATTTTERPTRITPNYKTMRRMTTTERTTTTSTTTTTTTLAPTKPTIQAGKPSAKDEILEVLTDIRGGERLAKILAERNMTLRELVEHRERGSSQVHLADIFKNASRNPDPSEPFLAKSSIAPISREIYPLKALLEGNMREPTGSSSKGPMSGDPDPPPMFMDITKTTQNEENLGIVTLFDKFSEYVGGGKILDPKDIKKDSDGSSYFTSVISVRPTDEIYRESRSEAGFHNKQMADIFSSLPTYIKGDEVVVDAKVVQDWNAPHNPYHRKTSIGVNVMSEKDVDGDGLIVLDDLQRIDQIDNTIAQASNQHIEDNFINQNSFSDTEPNFYTKLPVGVRSAILVSSGIVGTSLVVFLTIFVACRLRQRRRNLLRYEDSITAGMMRASIINSARKRSKNQCSSRSISPILTGETMYRNQKLNTMDSQTQRDAQSYLWDSLRRPFQ